MARLLSIAYDATLVRTRHLLLQRAGHHVESALGFRSAMEACQRPFDLIILGQVIPKSDKLELIGCFRNANPGGCVLALIRAGERHLKGVDGYVNAGDPEALLRAVTYFLGPSAKRHRVKARGAER